MNKRIFLVVLFIVLVATFLRFYKISQVPAGFFFDEETVGVNSYFLSNNLHDEFGNLLPDFIRIGEDFRHASIFYVTALFVKILGQNVFAVRAATATFGVLIVVATYFLVKQLIKNQKIAVLSAGLAAISPWLINLSRSSNEVVLALFFLMVADILFLKGLEKGQKRYFLLSYLFIILTWFSYSGGIGISFIHYFLIFTFALITKTTRKVKVLTMITFLCLLIFPNIFYVLTQPQKVFGRFNQVTIFTDRGTQLILDEQLREDGSNNPPPPVLISRLFHNKIVNYSSVIVNNYVQYFSGQFLLGQTPLPVRYKIPNFGLIYLIEIPFFLLGLYAMFKKLTWQKTFIISWFLVGSIPAALTLENIPNMQRAIFMLPAWQIVTAFGIYVLFSFKNESMAKYKLIRPMASVLTGIIFIYLLGFFMYQLFYIQPRHQNWYRGSEWESAVKFLDRVDGSYSQIKISGPLTYYHLAFFSTHFRDSIIRNPAFKDNRSYKNTWKLGKYSFVAQNCILPGLSEVELNTLYVNGQNCEMPTWARTVGEAKTSDGVVMLTFVDVPLTREKLEELISTQKEKELLMKSVR